MTDINDTKILLGLNFYRAFNLVTINCDNQCVCTKIAVDVINEFPRGLSVPNQSTRHTPPPVNIEYQAQARLYKRILWSFSPTILEEIGTLKDAIVKPGVNDNTITPVVQPPRKISQGNGGTLKTRD